MGYTRTELWNRIGLLREVDPLVDAAYKFAAQLEREKPRQGHSHEAPWHVSFHGSSFPGDDPNACGRAALYTMMDIPKPAPPRWLMQVADAGKGIEDSLVEKWYGAGYLVSAPAHLPWVKQTQFNDKKHWLTSTVDSILCWPRKWEPIVVEVKSKDSDVIQAMQRMIRDPDRKHVFQVKTQIGLAHEAGPIKIHRCFNSGRFAIEIAKGVRMCPEHGTVKCLREVELDPPSRGYIYYVSRDNPADTFEFMFEYDPEFMRQGREKLAKWRSSFLGDTLPATNFDDKRFSHPFGWQWTKEEFPCRYCGYGAICRDDHRKAVERQAPIALSESEAVADAEEAREDYSLEKVREATLAYWRASEEDLPEAA